MSSRKNGSLVKTLIALLMWILVLSAFGVTLKDIIAFDWLPAISEMLINFFTA